MLSVLNAETMKKADQKAIDNGTPSRVLMERAATAALDLLRQHFDTSAVLFLCGGGNNGGDGLAMARFFAEGGGNARLCYLGPTTEDGAPDTAKMSTECARQYKLLPPSVPVCGEVDTNGVTAVVDAIFGIGLTRPVEGRAKAAIQAVRAASIPTLAVDIPSGINADTGAVMGAALPATLTVAIAARKPGHLLFPGAELCGRVAVVDIGVTCDTKDAALLEQGDLAALPPRPANAHKGRFGRVLIIGGAVGMSGAAYFSAKAALRAGAGLVEILAPSENRVIYQTQLPEALLTLYDPEDPDENTVKTALARADAVAVGMGLSQSRTALRLTAYAMANAKCPLIADADALNLMGRDPALQELCFQRNEPTVLTPHLMEMSRISGTPIPGITADAIGHAKRIASTLGAVVVQKDARTVITDGKAVFINDRGNSGMATGGSGDVLAGVIASFAAQGANALDAARLGVLAHALAGDAALKRCGNHGMMASDIIEGLCAVLP